MCFATSTQSGARCELCLGTTHTAVDCALQGEPAGEVKETMRTMEATLLAASNPDGGQNHKCNDLDRCAVYTIRNVATSYSVSTPMNACNAKDGTQQCIVNGRPSGQMLGGRAHQPMKSTNNFGIVVNITEYTAVVILLTIIKNNKTSEG